MPTLLIVDDEVEYMSELAEAFEVRGISAAVAVELKGTLDVLSRDPEIVAVLTDMRMPYVDGMKLIDAIRRLFPKRSISFFVMTGHVSDVDISEMRRREVVEFFEKPVSIDTIFTALKRDLDARNQG